MSAGAESRLDGWITSLRQEWAVALAEERSKWMAEMGAKGGKKGGVAKVPKGFATMDSEKRAAAREKSLATRRANAAAKKNAALEKSEVKRIG